MDEYDYLEAQLDAPGAPAAARASAEPAGLPPPPPAPVDGAAAEAPREERSSKRDRERDERRSSRDRSRDRRDKDRSRSERSERDRDRDRRRSRSRSRDRDPRRYDRYPPGVRDDRDYRRHDDRRTSSDRGRDMDRRPPPRRAGTPPEERLQREREQELKELERTVRTVMVMNMNLRALEKDVFDHFAGVGPINDIRLICDKNTKKSKGICYIEYGTVDAAIAALTLNGSSMMGMPVLVKPSEAEKNMAWEAQQQAKQNQASAASLLNKMGSAVPGLKLNPIKLQVKNLHPDIGEEELKVLFSPFGDIQYCHVLKGPTGVSTGEAYVQFADEPMATAAVKHFDGFELADRKLSVQVAPLATAMPPPPPPPMLPTNGALPGPPPLPTTITLPAFVTGPHGVPALNIPSLPPGAVTFVTPGLPGAPPAAPVVPEPPVQNVNEVDDLDDSENKSFKLNAQSRAALMSRLATSAGLQAPPSFLGTTTAPGAGAPAAAPGLQVPQQVLLDQGLLGPPSPIPTPCLLLKNMFTDADKAEDNWQAEVQEDVQGEASKFGQVLHCHVDPNSKGHVYLKFATPLAAEAASRALHGRYYAGNQIVVSYQFLAPYNTYFRL